MFPEDLRYTDKHEWLRAGNGGTVLTPGLKR